MKWRNFKNEVNFIKKSKFIALILICCFISSILFSCSHDNDKTELNPQLPSYYETEKDIERPYIPEGTNYISRI